MYAIGLRCAGHTGITPADVVRVNLKVLPQDNVGFEIIQRIQRKGAVMMVLMPKARRTGHLSSERLSATAAVSTPG